MQKFMEILLKLTRIVITYTEMEIDIKQTYVFLAISSFLSDRVTYSNLY